MTLGFFVCFHSYGEPTYMSWSKFNPPKSPQFMDSQRVQNLQTKNWLHTWASKISACYKFLLENSAKSTKRKSTNVRNLKFTPKIWKLFYLGWPCGVGRVVLWGRRPIWPHSFPPPSIFRVFFTTSWLATSFNCFRFLFDEPHSNGFILSP